MTTDGHIPADGTVAQVWTVSTFGRVGSLIALPGPPAGGLVAAVITWFRGDTQGLVAFTLIMVAAGVALGGLG